MYEDVNYNFNWVGLIIKIIIFVILILLAIWVVSMTVSKKDIKSNFEQNLQYFKETAINYFDNDKLPKNNNEKVKITLKELINKNIILELNDENGNICNTDESYVEVKNNDGEYELLIKLVCGEESKIIKTNIENNECVNEECDINKDDTQTNNAVSSNINDSNKNSNNNTNNLNTNDKKETYYEYVKVNKIYTPWQLKKISGDNVEKKTDTMSISNFCKTKSMEYYSTGYVEKDSFNSYSYTVKLLNIPKNAIGLKITGKGYFDNDLSYYQEYYDNNNLSMVGGDINYKAQIPYNIYAFRETSLKSNNFYFSVSLGSKIDNYYTANIYVNIKNKYNVTPYFVDNLNKYVYFVPLYFYGEYVDIDDCIKDTNENATAYTSYKIYDTHKEKVTVYRSYTLEKDYNDTKWSTQSSLDGYVKTGKTELR